MTSLKEKQGAAPQALQPDLVPFAETPSATDRIKSEAERLARTAWGDPDFEKTGLEILRDKNKSQESPLTSSELKSIWHNALRQQKENNNEDLKRGDVTESEVAGNKHKLAMYLCHKYHVKTLDSPRDASREILIFKDGYYQPDNGFLRSEIQRIMSEQCTTHAMNEILRKCRDTTNINRDDFNVDPRYINLDNGIYDLEEQKLLPHDPKFLFRFKLPVAFNPEARCPLIEQALNDLLDEQGRDSLLEWIGFGLYRRYFLKKGCIWTGPKDTGKTTMAKLLIDFFGEENTSSVDLQSLSKKGNKFASSSLHERHVNIFDDMSAGDVTDTSTFKIAVGTGWMAAEKKFGDSWKFKNYSKLTFTCNTIPSVKEIDDDAFFDRWVIITFNNTIEKKDPFFSDKLAQPAELSGLLNITLEKLQILLKRGAFSYNKPPEDVKREMITSGDSIAAFVYDALEQGQHEGDHVPNDEMWDAYQQYTYSRTLAKQSRRKLGERLPIVASYIQGGKTDDGKTRVWRNVAVRWDVINIISKGLSLPVDRSDQDNSQDSPGTPLSNEVQIRVEEAFKLI